jgi:hypothetical protein
MMWNSVLFFTNTDIMIWICYIVKCGNLPSMVKSYICHSLQAMY